jgi:5-methylcytosine-specific restriction endonuclease McrA
MRLGSHMTAEQKAKDSMAHMNPSAETRAKISAAGRLRMVAYKIKVCQRCGNEYQPAGPTQKYCSECNPVVQKVLFAKWYRENSEKVKVCQARWRKENPEKVSTGHARWRKENPEKISECYAKWHKENPEKKRTSDAKWKRANADRIQVYGAKRRATKYGNTPISELLTSTEWLAILAEASGHCHYCGKEATLTLDHVIPVSKGGRHSKDNVVAACGHCNYSKGNKTLEEWGRTTGKGSQELQIQRATF